MEPATPAIPVGKRGDDVLVRFGKRRLSWTSALLIAAFVTGFALPAGWESPVPLCVVYAFTGVPCPLCGGTGAWVNMLHGNVVEAVRFHPGIAILVPLAVVTLVVTLRRDLFGIEPGPTWRRSMNVVGWGTLVFILGYGAIRAVSVLAFGVTPW